MRSRLVPSGEQLILGVLEVALERFQVGPRGEIRQPVFLGPLHDLFDALHQLGEILVELVGRWFAGTGRLFFPRQGSFQVVCQRIEHPGREVSDHLGHLLMLGLEILEPESQGPGDAQFRPRDVVIIQHLKMKDGLVPFLKPQLADVPIKTLPEDPFFRPLRLNRNFFLAVANADRQTDFLDAEIVPSAELQRQHLIAVDLQIFAGPQKIDRREAVGPNPHFIGDGRVAKTEGIFHDKLISLGLK